MDDEQLDPDDETQTWSPEPPSESEQDSPEREDPREAIGYLASHETAQLDRGATFDESPHSRLPPTDRDVLAKISGVPSIEVAREYCTTHTDQVVRPHYGHCPRCEGDRNRKLHDEIAGLRRELKADLIHPERERELVKRLYVIDSSAGDFISAVAARKAKGDGRSRGPV